MEISISDRAQDNIENIAEFSLKISTNYANRVISEIYSTIDSIKDAHTLEDLFLKYRISITESEYAEFIE